MSKSYLSEVDRRYQVLMDVYKSLHVGRSFLAVQADVKKIWRDELNNGKDEKLFNDKMVELNAKKEKRSVLSFFKAKSKETPKTKEPQIEKETEPEPEEKEETKIDNRKETKEQDKTRKLIENYENKLRLLVEERSCNQNPAREKSINGGINKTKLEISLQKKRLTRMQNVQKAVRKNRQKKKEFEEKLKVENPELAQSLKLRDGPGKPTIETDNPGKKLKCFHMCF